MTKPRTFLRSGHGAGGSQPHVENPIKDLPAGVPAPARPAAERDASGRTLPGPGTRELARRGGKAKAMTVQLARLMGLAAVPEGHSYAPYAKLARELRDEHLRRLADTVGGGEVGPGPASIVSSAALQLAASRYLSDRGALEGDAKMLLDASKLADASRQGLLAAHSLAALEAQARPKRGGLAALAARMGKEPDR